MATVFPTGLDSFATLIDNVDTVEAKHPNDRADAIEALEAKIGVNNSIVSNSLDYLIKSSNSIDPGHLHSVKNFYQAKGITNIISGGTFADMTDMSITQIFPEIDTWITFSAPIYTIAGSGYFRIMVDGDEKTMTSLVISGLTGGYSRVIPVFMQIKETLSAGSHTIKVQWYSNNSMQQAASLYGDRILIVR